MARAVLLVCLLVCQPRSATTVLQLTPAVCTPRKNVLPRHISSLFPLPRFYTFTYNFPHIFGVCNLLAHRNLINFLACSPHFCILVNASSPSCPQICRTLPTMGLGPTRWMLHLPSACCLIPMRDLVALRLGKFFFFHANPRRIDTAAYHSPSRTMHKVLLPLPALTICLLRPLLLEARLYSTSPLHLRLDFTTTQAALRLETNAAVLDTQSHPGYYYNAVAGQRQPLATPVLRIAMILASTTIPPSHAPSLTRHNFRVPRPC